MPSSYLYVIHWLKNYLKKLQFCFIKNFQKEKDVNGFESDTATAESGQSPPLTMSPLLPHSHSNGNGSSNVTNAATLAGMGRSSSNSAKMMNPTAALQLSQTLAAMHR